MAFEFIDERPSAEKQDPAIRKRIRAQAMRSFRRQQRLGQQADPSRRRGSVGDREAWPFPEDSHRTRRQDLMPGRMNFVGRNVANPLDETSSITQMFGLCEQWLVWMEAHPSCYTVLEVSKQAWDMAPSPLLLASTALAAIGYIQAMDPSFNAPDAPFKAKVLEEINERMLDIETATADSTISALILLTSFELSRSSREAMMHLSGLKRLVELRTSQDQTPLEDTSLMLDVLDLQHAVLFDTHPITDCKETRRPTRKKQKVSSSDFCDSMSDILRLELERLQDGPTQGFPSQDMAELLDCALACVSEVLRTSELDDVHADHFFDSLSIFSGCHCVGGSGSSLAATSLSRVVHQTAALLYNLICNENPPGHPSMESYVDGMLTAMNRVSLQVWNDLTSLQLLVVSIGFGFTSDPTRRSNLKCYLARPLVSGGKEMFPEMRSMTLQLAKVFRTLKWWVTTRGASNASVDRSASSRSRKAAKPPKTSRRRQQENLMPTAPATSGAFLPRRRRLPHEILQADLKFREAVNAIISRQSAAVTTENSPDGSSEEASPSELETCAQVERIEMAAYLKPEKKINILGVAQKYCDGIDTEPRSDCPAHACLANPDMYQPHSRYCVALDAHLAT